MDKLTLTEAHAALHNFLAAFEGVEQLRDAAAVVLNLVGEDPASLANRVVALAEQVRRAEANLAEVQTATQAAEIAHRERLAQLDREASSKQTQLDRDANAERRRLRDATAVVVDEERQKQTGAKETTAQVLADLATQVMAERTELERLQQLVRRANADLESLQQLVGRK